MSSASEYGTYHLTYTPPVDPGSEYPPIAIDMSTPGDASVSQMLQFFEAFLAAAGYQLKGDLQVVEPEPEETFAPFNLYSSSGFSQYGAAQPVTYPRFDFDNDVVTFG